MNILIIGSGAREHALTRALHKSLSANDYLYCFASGHNPGIKKLVSYYQTGNLCDANAILNFVANATIDFAIIGPEAPLAQGIADSLTQANIAVVGPSQQMAQIESSKSFTRDLLKKYDLPGGPQYQRFDNINGVADFLHTLGNDYVIKADGLMGGKGVKVSGEHLHTLEQALAYCQSLLDKQQCFVIEEKFIGEEFSLISACDGEHLVHMPAVQDHKRAFEQDTGPNTGGMGTYSDSNHRLPFLRADDIKAAQQLNEQVAQALKKEFNHGYKGFLYGGFMLTKHGVKLIEYNARFGDPEAMNILSLFESNFVELCQGIINGKLNEVAVNFAEKASVCKYLVPQGYPDNPVKGESILLDDNLDLDKVYFAAVDEKNGHLIETGSRTIAVVATADTITAAEKKVSEQLNYIHGPLFYRKDIGTKALIDKRVQHMQDVLNA